MPAEWLASTERGLQVHWQDLSDTGLVPGAAVAPARDGGLIEISPLGQLARLRLRADSLAGSLVFDRTPVAWLDPRRSTPESPVVARELADGRVVVAGGEVQRDRVALWSPEVDKGGAPDRYVATGHPSPDPLAEIVAPDGRVTRLPPSNEAGGTVVLLEDGRVVKAHAASDGRPSSFEMSDASTNRWTALPAPPGDLARGQRWHLAAAGTELLLAGDTTAHVTHLSLRAVWRLDLAGHRWDTLWREVASDPAHHDIPVVRDLVVVALPGGRHEVVAMKAP